MDTAKLVAMVLAHGGDPTDYTGDCRVPGPVKPLICLPTTAGTGSEVSAAAVFTDTAKKIKVSCLSPYLRPNFAIVDPLYTVSCPAKVTADSGIDALTHAIEGFTAVDNDAFPLPPGENTVYQGKNPMADLAALETIRLVGRYLRRAVKDGNDLEARDGMALAATLGGMAFSNAGVALVHAMEYPVGGAVHVSHGAGNGLLLPFVMRFNKEKRIEEFVKIGLALGGVGELTAAQPVTNAIEERSFRTLDYHAESTIKAIEELRADIGIPLRLRDIGVKEEMLLGFAEKAFAIKRLMRVNPRMPQNETDILDIYRAAF
jgi:alcohol dehydrogenase class IV